jgi:trehalose/maltose hydrolase-like predicted phosphorylase
MLCQFSVDIYIQFSAGWGNVIMVEILHEEIHRNGAIACYFFNYRFTGDYSYIPEKDWSISGIARFNKELISLKIKISM